ncbi:carboxypeptidase N subunit 2 [Engraulis encrasicolus]|uniref:carboxypeptidase N subunit 2 n=1 Tax=Engraulis encrasicolus TaxID=184585 RepID=UPI002FD22BAF
MLRHGRIAVLLLLLLLQNCCADGCPPQCQCFMGSKVMCSEERMFILPVTLSPQVKELIVITSGLTSIPANSFQTSPQLTKLALISNPLRTSSISPLAFNGLTQLRELEISANYRLETLDHAVFQKLGNLTRLYLNNNQLLIVDRDMFNKLVKLEVLELRGNQFIWLPNFIFENLPNLKSLDASMNKITSVEASLLAGLTRLQSLKLAYNQLTTLPSDLFKHAPGLKHLSFQSNGISSLPEGLFKSLTKLEELNLRYNKLTYVPTDTFPSSLKDLNLQGNHLTILSLGNLPLLTDLVLSSNNFTDLPSNFFENATSLERLDLSENQLLSVPANVFSGLSKIVAIHLHKNNLTSLQADLLKDQQEVIERLTLSDNQLKNLPEAFFDPFMTFRMSLRGNPWHCDCNLTYLHAWLQFGSNLVEDLSRTYCKGPATLRGQSLMSVEGDQLVCSYNSNTTNALFDNSVQAPAEEDSSQGQANQCILQQHNGVYSLKCTVTNCSNVKIEAHIYGPDGSVTDYVLDKEWSETSQCVNGTITVNV